MGAHKRSESDEKRPRIVNGKYRYCRYCGQMLYESDVNFFYHKSCHKTRTPATGDLFSGGSSFE